MVPYYGDYAANATVYIPINTFDSNDPAASVTVTNLVNTDVHIHKDGGTTQRNNAAGITMTVDFDSITGNHLLIIDTSDNTVADFWEAGHEYQVRIEGATVDGGTINAWVGSFSIERAGGALALIKSATYGLSALKTLLDTTGIKVASFADNAITAASINADAITNAKIADNAIAAENLAADCITNAKIADNAIAAENIAADAITAAKIANGAIDNATFAADVGSTAYATNIIALAARKAIDEYDPPTNAEFELRTLPAADYTVVSDLGTVQTGDSFAIVNGDHGLVSIQDDIDAIKAKTDSLTFTVAGDVDCNVQTWKGSAAQDMTGDSYARLGAPAGASVSADIAAVKAETAAILDDTPTAIAAVKTVVDLIEDILRNKMEITDANGNLVLYEDDGTTPKYSVNACVTDDATTTIRKRLE